MIKGTSIASVIFVNELTFRSQQIVGQNFKFFTVFAAAGLIYLVMTSAIALLQALLERRYSRCESKPRGNGGRAHVRLPAVAAAHRTCERRRRRPSAAPAAPKRRPRLPS